MSATELRIEISRIRPPPLMEVVEQQPEVVQALRQAQGLAQEAEQKRSKMLDALRENRDWREDHPLRAKAHDAGWVRSKVLLETEQRRVEAQAGWHRLEPLANEARQQKEYVLHNTENRIVREQAPVLAKVAELERIEREKRVKERDEQARVREADKLLSEVRMHALKREMKAKGYEDTGKHWKALAEPVRSRTEA